MHSISLSFQLESDGTITNPTGFNGFSFTSFSQKFSVSWAQVLQDRKSLLRAFEEGTLMTQYNLPDDF